MSYDIDWNEKIRLHSNWGAYSELVDVEDLYQAFKERIIEEMNGENCDEAEE